MRMQAVGQKAASGDRYTLGTAPLSEDDRRSEPSLRGEGGEYDFDDLSVPPPNRTGRWLVLIVLLTAASAAGWVYRAPILAMFSGQSSGAGASPDGASESGAAEPEVAGSGATATTEGVGGSGDETAETEGSSPPAGELAEDQAVDVEEAATAEPPGPVADGVRSAATPSAEPVRLGADALMERGNRALERGDAEQALEYFGRASELSRSPEPHLGVARAYERMGRHDLAILRYERAVELSPRFAPAWAGLAAIRERMGNANALDTWLRVHALTTDGRTRLRAEEAIRRLGGSLP